MGNNILKPISCKKCGGSMQWQMSSDDCLLHCHTCRRAVVVSDWKANAKLFGK